MGLLDYFTKNRSRSVEREIERLVSTMLGQRITVLDANDETYIKDGYNKNLFVYMIISYITGKASQIPIKLMQKTADGEQVEIFEHPILDLLDKPNPYTDGTEFIKKSLGYYLLTGNNYSWDIRLKGQEYPKETHILPSQFIDIISGRTWAHAPTAYRLTLYGGQDFPADQVTHFKNVNYDWDNGQHLYGSSPLRAGLETLNQSNSVNESFTKQAQNDGIKGLLMQKPSEEVAMIQNEQLKDWKDKVKEAINGNDKKGLIEVTNVLFDYLQLGMSAADMQLLESHKISKKDLASLYNLSSILFNDDSASTFNNYETAVKMAYIDSIIPALNEFLAKLTQSWLRPYDRSLYLEADYSKIEVLQKDLSKLVTALASAWWVPTQQKQKMTGVEVDDSLPKYLVPANLFPIDDATDPLNVDEEIDKHLRDLGLNRL